MKYIQLTQNKIAIIDDDDYNRIIKYKWYAINGRNDVFYAVTNINGLQIEMHKFILESESLIDHINYNGLDNRKSNLRIATQSQNSIHRRKINSKTSSRYKGVSWHSSKNKWRVQIMKEGNQLHVGYFLNEEDAARAYDKSAYKLFGEFAELNFKE